MTTIHCALIDAADVFQGMVDVDEAALTDRHLTSITECDLLPGLYRWVRHDGNEFGGEFKSVKSMEAQARLDMDAERGKTLKAGDIESIVDAAVKAKLKALLNIG